MVQSHWISLLTHNLPLGFCYCLQWQAGVSLFCSEHISVTTGWSFSAILPMLSWCAFFIVRAQYFKVRVRFCHLFEKSSSLGTSKSRAKRTKFGITRVIICKSTILWQFCYFSKFCKICNYLTKTDHLGSPASSMIRTQFFT